MQISDFPEIQLPLVIDVSSPLLQVGIPAVDDWVEVVSESGQVMEGLFPAIDRLFKKVEGSINSIDALFYCCGPGSTLGLRLAAAVTKTLLWEKSIQIPFFQYNALDLATCMTDEQPPSFQAPFRMGRRIVRTGEHRGLGKKEIVDEEIALQKFPQSMHLHGPRKIDLEIPQSQMLEYNLQKVNGLNGLFAVAEQTEQPQPFSPEPAKFTKWKREIPAKK